LTLTTREADIHAGAVVIERLDRILEAIANRAVLGQAIEQGCQFAARQLDILARLIDSHVIDRD
jgi:hypothetical protein